MPTFARPIAGGPARPEIPSSTLSAFMPMLSLVALSCAALFLFARPNGAESLPAGKAAPVGHKRAVPAAQKTKTLTGKSKAASVSGADDRQSLDFYTSNVRDGMFSAPQPPRAKPTPPPVLVKPPKPLKPLPPFQIFVAPINPFADWSYTGTVHMGDITMALLENTKTKEGQYVKSGDKFMGAEVQSINDQMVTLTNGGKPSMLAKADTMIITPLSQNATGQNPAQGGPQNGQPGGQPQNMPPMGDSNQPSITLPNGRVLSGDRATRYQQRLDRGFGGNGGGNGGNGGGNGGRRRGGNGGAAPAAGG